jgi:SHS family lactate transporter-like MFS transporter
MSLWIGVVALILALLVWLGPEARGLDFEKEATDRIPTFDSRDRQ